MAKQDRYPQRYNVWGGNPKGKAPDYDRCARAVYKDHLQFQCKMTCGHGPDGAYCKQHAKTQFE